MDLNLLNEKVGHAFLKQFNLPIQFMSPDAIVNAYYTYEKLESMADWIKERVSVRPSVAIICGSGLGDIANLVEGKEIVPYADIPEFPRSTVLGHKGNLVFGTLSSLSVVCMQGRFHAFEGYSYALCTLPIKIFKLLGVKLIVITNAVGSLNSAYDVGDLMVIKDHISFPLLALSHPLIGPHDDRIGPRFTPVNNVYMKRLRDVFLACGRELDIRLHEGVYGSVGGPTYETVTDARLCRQTGMDCVGMSTSHEAVVAANCGLKVLAFCIVTDKVVMDYDVEEYANHDEIVKVANARAKDAERLVAAFLKTVATSMMDILE